MSNFIEDMGRDYRSIILLSRDKKLNFWIDCYSKRHKTFVKDLINSNKCYEQGDIKYYLGKKYQVFIEGKHYSKVNFNDKMLWRKIDRLII